MLENPTIKRMLEKLLDDKKREEEILWPSTTKKVIANKSINNSLLAPDGKLFIQENVKENTAIKVDVKTKSAF
jgi:hypothetical protein